MIKEKILKHKNILLIMLSVLIIFLIIFLLFNNKNFSSETIKEEYNLVLVGEKSVSIYVGDIYNDLGCLAYDKDNNDVSDKLIINNYVDTTKVGTYKVVYGIIENNIMKSIEREVLVKDNLGINITYDDRYTNDEVLVTIDAKGTDFSYIMLPDLTRVDDTIATYKITKNGSYMFFVYDKFGKSIERIVTINNIDKSPPTATCVAHRYSNRMEIDVSSYDENGILNYVYNDVYTSDSNKYTINNKTDSVSVKVYDVSGNVNHVSCQIIDHYIEMHFIAGISDDDAILIRTFDKTIMIDGGQYGARDKIVSYLKDLNVTKIDALIGSHVHWNHVQSHAAILDNFQVDNIYYSVDILNCVSLGHCKSDDVKYIKNKLIELKKTPTILAAKDKLMVGDMGLYMIGPIRGKLTTYQNANSLVFILTYGNNKFLFTGDTPSKYMDTSKFLMNANYFGMNLDVDVIKFPHHGYENLSDSLFKEMTPKYAIIPNCCHCSSKYPSSTNKNLMKKYGVSYYQVCDSKNIVLISDGDNIEIRLKQSAKDYAR